MWNQYPTTTVFVTPVYLFNIVIGTVANLFVISSYLKSDRRGKHAVFNFLIANFSLANLLQTALFNPILLAYRAFPDANVIANTGVCSVSLFTCMLAITMSFAIFPLLAYERHESFNARPLPLTTIKGVVYILWTVCSIAALVYMVMVLRDTSHAPLGVKRDRCIIASQGIDYVTVSFIVYSMVVYGAAILCSMFFLQQPVSAPSEVRPDEAERTRAISSVMVGTILLWLPFTIIQFVGIFGTYTEATFNYHGCSSAIGLLAPALAPLLLMKGGLEETNDAGKKAN